MGSSKKQLEQRIPTSTNEAPRGFRFFLFASPQLALATLGLPIVIYLPAYYAGPLGLGLAATGFIFMITRFWDVITDGFLGWAVDRFPTRWGRRKVWMIVSTPLMVLGTIAICFPPEGAGNLYLMFWLTFIYIWWTLIHLCHIAWAAELSDRYDERSSIQSRVLAVYFSGLLLVLTAPIAVGAIIGDTGLETKVRAMGIYAAVLLPLTVLASVFMVRERPAPPRDPSEKPMNFTEGMALAVRNPALLRLLGVDMLAGLAGGTASGLFVFVTRELFELEGALTIAGFALDPGALLIFTYAGAFFGVPIWLKLSYRIGKHHAVSVSAIVTIVAFLYTLIMPKGDFLAAAIFYLVNGIAFGAAPFLDRAMLADVVDLDQTKTGEQRTGFFFALMSMTNKIGYALPIGIIFPLLDVIGFDPNGNNDPQAIAWLGAIFVGVPILLKLLIVALLWRFPINREMQESLRTQLATQQAS
ncbi:MFS transporter [Erythrobacter sp.]|uniref:MFS transporter n=1 Tax=Erythrobacter sp. TaxID=1042 RepID=UPI001B244A64|nr:MFS transporter [Erythrobacter sp.]MBO6525416.1 MFS transporter [Erythrobacter sp.]MBO6529911.1 MFS transporter [Erythrobacter sp.]